MRVDATALTAVGERILQANGVEPGLACTQIDLLIEAQMRGYPSHGMLRLRRIVERIRAGVVDPNQTGRHEWQRTGQLLVDGNRGLGPVVAMEALKAIQARAEETGIALAAVRNSNHVGMLAWYGEKVSAGGQILIASTTSEALVHPWGGKRALLGTNPICIAVPASPEPLVLDMATGLVSMGKIHDYANRGQPLPEGWALDAAGNPTTDANAAKGGAIAPFGGAKGYALGLALEVLVTTLAGSAIGTDVVGTLDSTEVCNKGDIFIVVTPCQGDGILALVSGYLDEIRDSGRSGAAAPVTAPGDRARQARQASLAEGVEIDEALWDELQALERDGL
jgi:LDH2 family malate/lactate/ureidoglycolate dehydrogenase